ncbi:Alpha-1,6-mannosyl-glycoprotein 2-beta-N-acetylglucosaminyltransferase [Dirofilaria immitis]|nr:Alpha-1,6-mannosyl-glycoprotein 2-beta-N-acetylglucosaminyltransferase [Dirofilaria immitis]
MRSKAQCNDQPTVEYRQLLLDRTKKLIVIVTRRHLLRRRHQSISIRALTVMKNVEDRGQKLSTYSGMKRTNAPSSHFSRLCLGGEIVQVPTIIVEQETVFRAVITKHAFQSLGTDTQNYLKRFLPKYEESDKDEEKILDIIFTADPNLYFGNPLGKLHSKIRCKLSGWFNPERPSDQVQLRDNRRVLYDHYIRHYYMTVLKSLLISRNREFVKYTSSSVFEEPVAKKVLTPGFFENRKYRKELNGNIKPSARGSWGKTGFSSDEEEFGDLNKIPMARAGQSTLFPLILSVNYDLHQPVYMDDVKRMLKDYKNLKEQEPDSPSLDISDIGIENVYERAGVACIAERNLSAEVSEAMKLPFKSIGFLMVSLQSPYLSTNRNFGHSLYHAPGKQSLSISEQDDRELELGWMFRTTPLSLSKEEIVHSIEFLNANYEILNTDKHGPLQNVEIVLVMQIFYPYNIQLFPDVFPGQDPSDCPEKATEQDCSLKCNNWKNPDKYGHFRVAQLTQIKHHWWWKMNYVFDGILKQYVLTKAWVILLEEDHYVSPDFLHVMRLIVDNKSNFCAECQVISLGLYLKQYNNFKADLNRLGIYPWFSSKHNMGMAINTDTWKLIKNCTELFCKYDDYNWDWSLLHVSMKCLPSRLKVITVKAPRVIHIGDCGIHTHRCAVHNATTVAAELFSSLADSLFPQKMVVAENLKRTLKPSRENGGWGDIRDHELCLNNSHVPSLAAYTTFYSNFCAVYERRSSSSHRMSCKI